MTLNGWLQILLYFAVILLLTKPMGVFMAKVFSREKHMAGPGNAASRKIALQAHPRR